MNMGRISHLGEEENENAEVSPFQQSQDDLHMRSIYIQCFILSLTLYTRPHRLSPSSSNIKDLCYMWVASTDRFQLLAQKDGSCNAMNNIEDGLIISPQFYTELYRDQDRQEDDNEENYS